MFLSLGNSILLMKESLKQKKNKPFFEVNWNIREIFSESALTSFCDEIDNQYLEIEKNKN